MTHSVRTLRPNWTTVRTGAVSTLPDSHDHEYRTLFRDKFFFRQGNELIFVTVNDFIGQTGGFRLKEFDCSVCV